nr:LOW QUALITY PROTEIN: protein PopC-like [Lytechinus pictus]
MNHLKNLTLDGSYHDDFYSTLATMASIAKIETLVLDEDLTESPSASRDLAQFICKMNNLKNLTLRGDYHDDFYSTLSSMASIAKIETLVLDEDLTESPSASRDLAQFICKMNNLKNLTLRGDYHDDFYSTLSSMASIAKIETLVLDEYLTKSPSVSRDLAQFICKMNNLKNLTLRGNYHDDFYSTLLSMASIAKTETLRHDGNLSERPSASRDLAQFICKMNHLKNLTLDGSYHDDFYSTLASMASIAKIETLFLDEDLTESPSASRDLAQFICKMNNLKNLTLRGDYHDDFYSTLSSMASIAKIETLVLDEDLTESPSASRDLAQFICKMNNLKNLTLRGDYHDDFYSTLSSMASIAKIETLVLDEYLTKSPSVSRDLAQFICKMNNLKNLTLRGNYHDDFYSTLLSMASIAKIECLNIIRVDLSQRLSASRDLAQFICKMPNLRELCLGNEYGTTSPSLHEEFYSTLSSLASSAKIERLNIICVDLSQRLSASRDLAQFICKMPNLRELHLGGKYGTTRPSLHEEFYSTLSSLASTVKVLHVLAE